MSDSSITVGEFKRRLKGLDDDDILHLPAKLGFYRIRTLSDGEHIIEQSEPEMFADDEFRAKNPYFKVAYLMVEEGNENTVDIRRGTFNPTIKQ